MSNKRKGDDSKGKKSPKTLKRAGTMDVTAQEGKEFLEQEAPELVNTPKGKEGVETRGKTQARTTIDNLLRSKKKLEELTPEEKKKEENKLKMVFRLFDKDKDGHLDADELMEAMRTVGKKPTKAKITKMITSMSTQKKNDTISSDDFVKYMLNKLYKDKETEKAGEAKAKETEKEKEKEKEKVKEKETEKKTPTKGKKAAAKKGAKAEKEVAKKEEPKKEEAKKAEEKKEDKGKGKAVDAENKPLERTRSITEFYTEHAGMNTEIAAEKLDKFSNPQGVEFDLGVEGAFNGYVILVANFCSFLKKEDFNKYPLPPLQSKGFNVVYTQDEKEFITKLPEADVAWIISKNTDPTNPTEFLNAVRTFHEGGGGLYIWADNEPWVKTANPVLNDLLKVTLNYSTPGNKTLQFGDALKSGFFGSHLITSGIAHLFEGITICYPEKTNPALKTVATSSDNHPVVMVAEPGEGGLKESSGRIVVDCGFTKIYNNWDTAGTARYVVNANVWLIGLDHRMRKGMPLNRRGIEV